VQQNLRLAPLGLALGSGSEERSPDSDVSLLLSDHR
jgi:hypothetical protein